MSGLAVCGSARLHGRLTPLQRLRRLFTTFKPSKDGFVSDPALLDAYERHLQSPSTPKAQRRHFSELTSATSVDMIRLIGLMFGPAVTRCIKAHKAEVGYSGLMMRTEGGEEGQQRRVEVPKW